jgi:hypothetical protein
VENDAIQQKVAALVDRYRTVCFWFAPPTYYPRTESQIRQALRQIEQHGDREAFQAAREIAAWL